jgi:hypothetical protein
METPIYLAARTTESCTGDFPLQKDTALPKIIPLPWGITNAWSPCLKDNLSKARPAVEMLIGLAVVLFSFPLVQPILPP